jgi:hypothetical protein
MMAKRKEMKNVTIGPVAKQESSSSPNVKFVRSELVRLQPAYCMIRDCIEGELAVKGILQNGPEALVEDSKGLTYNGMGSQSYLPNVQRAKRYLPQPNPEDQSQENINRYVSYVQRAVFYNVTGRTLEGLAGQIFLRDPIFEIPEMLQSLLKDADGKGVALHQLAKRAVRWVLAYGRCGLHVDYPSVDRATVKQLKDGQISPIVTVYEPWNVINWRTVELNGKRVLSLVVLREFVEDETDQFETKLVEQYRILRLDVNTGTHTVEVYSKDGDTLKSRGVFEPKDGDGKPLVGIPFCFVGSEANDAIPDNPPLYDLATLNIAHYRNSVAEAAY